MLNHHDIWTALDKLAVKFTLTPSSMARQAGLNPTTFNKSKRHGADGKPRWPSTESLSKVLNMLGVDFEDFAALVAKKKVRRVGRSLGAVIPLIGLSEAVQKDVFDGAGFPIGEDWDDIRVPGVRDEHVYALQISDNSMAPVLRKGDRIVVAPNENIEPGDRVVIKTHNGQVFARELESMSVKMVKLNSINPAAADQTIALKDIHWIARIVWVTQ